MINLEKAIKNEEEVTEELEKRGLIHCDSMEDTMKAEECRVRAAYHRQLAEWLKKLQAYEEAKEEMINIERACNSGLNHAIYIIDKHLKEVNADGDSN